MRSTSLALVLALVFCTSVVAQQVTIGATDDRGSPDHPLAVHFQLRPDPLAR